MNKTKNKSNKRTARTIGFMIVFSIIVIAGYYYVRTSTKPIFSNSTSNLSEKDALLSKDIASTYPSSPKEVLKLYSRLMKELYSGKLEDAEIDQLADQLLALYDEELKANKSHEQYLLDLKVEITDYKKTGRTIMNNTVEASKDTKYWEDKGKEYASLLSSYTLKEGGDYTKVIENFIFRKDTEGNWKILGWKMSDETDFNTKE